MTFGEILRELRKEKNMSQAELAKLINVEQATVSTWENATRQPDFQALKKLSIIFDVSSDFLIGLEDEFGDKTKKIV